MKQKNNWAVLGPVMFGFFIMGFCDVVGVATSFVKLSFGLSATIAGLLPSAVFLWFLFLSIPASVWMNKFGRKNVVLVSLAITFIGVLLPYVYFTLATCLIGFSLLGIGNTILQVSLNPLLSNIVKDNNYTSALTAGQFIKSISSFLAPLLCMLSITIFGVWHGIFAMYAGLTLISLVWLWAIPVQREKLLTNNVSFDDALELLVNRRIFLLFGAIIFIVGVDIGINTVTPQLLIERCSLETQDAAIGSSVYFALRFIGTFVGIILLKVFHPIRYFRFNIVIAFVALVLLFFAHEELPILILVGVIGFTCSTVFSIIYAQAIKVLPEQTNEISGLLITGIFGGALVTPLMGVMADWLGGHVGSLIVIALCCVYLVVCAFTLSDKKEQSVLSE